MSTASLRPSGAFIGASWAALAIGGIGFIAGIWNSAMPLNEKGYYFTVLLFGLFAAISLQKTVRDRLEGVPVTGIYYGVCWTAMAAAIVLLVIGLWNADFSRIEKGFYAMAFLLAMFGVVAVQKNIRDAKAADALDEPTRTHDPNIAP
ncbi:inner membrane protein YiaA [Solimonas soli]|uniref:inner membrane protein YiaA n=1 Tax=Solimonas soli TaxID=413479 RepID=UPI000488A992|nr:inner membrane protein YiaA [Solimonas soli]